jgi:hypothetical protein
MRRILLDDQGNQRRDRLQALAIGGFKAVTFKNIFLSDGREFLGTDGVSLSLTSSGERVWNPGHETTRDPFQGVIDRIRQGGASPAASRILEVRGIVELKIITSDTFFWVVVIHLMFLCFRDTFMVTAECPCCSKLQLCSSFKCHLKLSFSANQTPRDVEKKLKSSAVPFFKPKINLFCLTSI